MVGESALPIAQIMGDIVIRGELICFDDTFIEKISHPLVILVVGTAIELLKVVAGYRFTERNVHPTLLLNNTRKDAVQILTGLLDILGISRFVQLQCLEDIARLPFVRHRNRYDVKLVQSPDLVS